SAAAAVGVGRPVFGAHVRFNFDDVAAHPVQRELFAQQMQAQLQRGHFEKPPVHQPSLTALYRSTSRRLHHASGRTWLRKKVEIPFRFSLFPKKSGDLWQKCSPITSSSGGRFA